MTVSSVLLYGQVGQEVLARLGEAAAQAGCELTRADSLEHALTWLEAHDVRALLCRSDYSEQLAVHTRSRARFSKLPVLALAEVATDLEFFGAFSWGADDLVPLEPMRSLVHRLRALPKEAPAPPTEKRGEALISELDHTRRVVVARVLRNAGYSIRFAVRAEDAESFATDPALALVVTSHELLGDPSRVVTAARRAGSQASFIVCTPPRELKSTRVRVEGLDGITVTDAYTAPENVLFVANELTCGRTNGRASPRVAYGTMVGFRVAGRDHDEYGFTYNVSENGLYVRTLALPDEDEVWLELCPPRLDIHVRLTGRVAWRRPFNFSENATVPPGFGVQIADGAAKDRALWIEGTRSLLHALG